MFVQGCPSSVTSSAGAAAWPEEKEARREVHGLPNMGRLTTPTEHGFDMPTATHRGGEGGGYQAMATHMGSGGSDCGNAYGCSGVVGATSVITSSLFITHHFISLTQGAASVITQGGGISHHLPITHQSSPSVCVCSRGGGA